MKRNLSAIAAICAGIVLSGSAIAQFEGESDSRIAFVQGPDIFSMKPDGSDVRQLTNLGPNDSAFWENWSSDGRQIVFTRYSPDHPPQLWLMNADGSAQHLLLSEPEHDEEAPSFSADGQWVIFTRCPFPDFDGFCAIYRIRTDGTALSPVLDFEPALGDWEPVSSPDGLNIAFDGFHRLGVETALWIMNANGSDLHRLTPPELGAVNLHWSPDGETIVFTTHGNNPQNADLWVIRRDGNGLHRLTGSAATDQDIPVAYYNQAPSWSPHGRAIVFSQYVPSTNTQAIFVMNADGSGRTRVRTLPAGRPRLGTQASTGKSQPNNPRRQRQPREIENGGAWARWSPTLQ
jgi:Tol biopolymer transport system component